MITFTNNSLTKTYILHSFKDNYYTSNKPPKKSTTPRKYRYNHTPSNHINPDSHFFPSLSYLPTF